MQISKSSMCSRAICGACSRRQHRAADRGSAEHRHGVLPDSTDQQRQDRPRPQGRRARPVGTKGGYGLAPEEVEALSRIIAELNERFGLNLGPEHRVTLAHMMEKLDDDAALEAAARVNTRENVRLTFDHKVENVIQEIVETNFDLYKRITDDRAFGDALKNFLFDQYVRGHRNAEELIKRGESKPWSSNRRCAGASRKIGGTTRA